MEKKEVDPKLHLINMAAIFFFQLLYHHAFEMPSK